MSVLLALQGAAPPPEDPLGGDGGGDAPEFEAPDVSSSTDQQSPLSADAAAPADDQFPQDAYDPEAYAEQAEDLGATQAPLPDDNDPLPLGLEDGAADQATYEAELVTDGAEIGPLPDNNDPVAIGQDVDDASVYETEWGAPSDDAFWLVPEDGPPPPEAAVTHSTGGGGGTGVRGPIPKRWPPKRTDDDEGETAILIAFLLGDDRTPNDLA